MRQKLGTHNLENMNGYHTWVSSPEVISSSSECSQPESEKKEVNDESTIKSIPQEKINVIEKQSRPPKMRIKQYLEIETDTDVCLKRPRELSESSQDKRRKLELEIPENVILLSLFLLLFNI